MVIRRLRAAAPALLALVLARPLAAAAAPGDLDPTFGNAGRAVVAFPGEGSPRDLLVLPDGRIVMGGTIVRRDTGTFAVGLARLDASGALDPQFGDAGITITDFSDTPNGGQLSQLVGLPDGRLLVGGFDFPNALSRTVIGRFRADGTLDQSFGQGGLFLGIDGAFAEMVVDGLGILVLAHRSTSSAVERSLTLIHPFGTGTTFDLRPADLRTRAMRAQADGRVVFVEVGPRMVVTRLDGIEKDPTFGAQGEATVPPDVALTEATAIVPLADGRIVITGTLGTNTDADAGIVRLLPDGTPDASFGEGGRALLPARPRFDDVHDVVPLADGRLLTGGRTCPRSECTGYLAVLREDGRLDRSFGVNGIVDGLPVIDALALPDGEHLLAVGKENGQMVVTRHLLATCGNGVLEAGETCDDGNQDDGDCCASDCAADPEGSACLSDGSVCTADVCRAGSCTHEPPADAGCAIAESSALVLVDDADDAADRVRLRWSSTTVPPGALGDPTRTTDVSLCVIDGPPEARRVLTELTVPGGSTCGDSPCWRRTASGFRYRDRTTANDGVGRLVLSVDGTDASILLKAKGPGTDVRTLATGDRLLIRVVQSDTPGCFESTVVADGTGATRLRAATR
jgi:uncharacterized delta-60 repeat protein